MRIELGTGYDISFGYRAYFRTDVERTIIDMHKLALEFLRHITVKLDSKVFKKGAMEKNGLCIV